MCGHLFLLTNFPLEFLLSVDLMPLKYVILVIFALNMPQKKQGLV